MTVQKSRFFPAIALFLLLVFASARAQERPPIYPFDVTISGQKAEYSSEFPLFAKITDPVSPTAEVSVSSEPEMIIANIFPCDSKGTTKPGASPKVIMVQSGTSFKLDQTMDKSVLGPGTYGTNLVLKSKGTSRVMFVIGNKVVGEPAGDAPDQSTPTSTLQALFDNAKSGNFAALKLLVPEVPGLDGDVRRIASVPEAKPEEQREFQEWFSTGKIDGEARIEGDKAEVDFLFGPKGDRNETMNLIKKDGNWYLFSF